MVGGLWVCILFYFAMVNSCRLRSGRGRLLGAGVYFLIFIFFLLWFVVMASGPTMEVVEVAVVVALIFVVVVYHYFNELFILF